MIYDPLWLHINIIIPLKKEGLFNENDSLENLFFIWFALTEQNKITQSHDWLDSQLSKCEDFSETTGNGEKTNEWGKMFYFKEKEIELFGDKIENVLLKNRYTKKIKNG